MLVMFVGAQIMVLGFDMKPLTLNLLIKYVSIFSVTSKSEITPSFSGLIARMLLGVLPTILYASEPTANNLFVLISTATTDGSFSTIPFPVT